MFVLCVYMKTKDKMQDNEDKEPSMDAVQRKCKIIKNLGETRFSAPVQTGPGAPSTCYIIGTGFSAPGVKRPGCGLNHSPPLNAEVKERLELYLYFPSGPSWPVLG
jgi:hypothetical protein